MMGEQIQILLADDDEDDCMFFKDALESLPYPTKLDIVHNGVLLMKHLGNNIQSIPDVLFLDLNMPLKNGFDCLVEIKNSKKLKELRVVIFSTTSNQEIVNSLYDKGAEYFIQKPADFLEIKKVINHALSIMALAKLGQPLIKNFQLTGDYK